MTLHGVIFAGGGTGGHIFPAIAIAEQLNETGSSPTDPSSGQYHPPLPVAYLCSARDIDRRILEPRSLHFTPIPASPFSLHPQAFARFILGWGASVNTCKRTIRDHCQAWNIDPSDCALVATGGFVCAPAAAAARKLGCAVAIVNLDAVPGKAVRLLARNADRIFTTYPAFGLEPVGPIVRKQAIAPDTPESCRKALGLDPHLPTLVVSGASQGATSLNEFVLALVRASPDMFAGWQILHQAGPDRADLVQTAYRHLPVPAKVVGLLDEVGLMWGAATLAIARAGAGTVAELFANQVHTLFLPYPFHHDQHQKRNAQPMVDAGLAEILEDHIDPSQNAQHHAARIRARLKTPPASIPPKQTTQVPNGAQQIAHFLRNL